MRTVFRFSKGGPVRYISHLDLMRAMHRAVRRAGLPAAWSKGYHPHIVLSFAQALGLGYLSVGEYMELSLDGSMEPGIAMEKLNGALPAGLEATGCWFLDDAFPTLMAAVTAARWRVDFLPDAPGDAVDRLTALLERDAVEVEKTGKAGTKTADIRPGILAAEGAGGAAELLLAAGSAMNVRPELAVKAALGPEGAGCVRAYTRLELYATRDGRQLPIYQFCIDGDRYER